ncbi:hypothetical protein BAE46_08160 [Glaciecola punicea]|jgi:hypothetical protein|nr:hypothetical protein BAE46_08160 [Glaciecola punicea]
MARALQNIMRKHRPKVRYYKHKAALLMTLANNDHSIIAYVLKVWLHPMNTSPNDKAPLSLKK